MQLFIKCNKIVMVIKMISPFEGISSLQKARLIEKLESHIYNFNKNEEILPKLKNTNILCILIEGHAKIVNINYLGEENLLEELLENDVFGTNISSIDNADYQIIALEDCKVLLIDYNKLIDIKNINCSYYNLFILNLFQILNAKFKENNNRIQILTKKNIRDKLLAFFENEYRRTRSQTIYLSSNFKNLADYLSINRSAMFRELKALKDENFIKVKGKRITLLYVPNM